MQSSSSTPTAAEEADDDQADAASAELAACLARVALGDRAAFRDLYARTSAHLMGVAFALLHQRARAEEVLQDAYASVWQNAARYDARIARPMTWLIHIVRNRAIDVLRAQRAELAATEPLDDVHEATIAAFAPSPDTLLHQAAQRARVDGALQQLAPQQRQALALVLYRGLSYPEVAAHAGVPLPTAKAWIRRSLERLRGRLDSAGLGPRACA